MFQRSKYKDLPPGQLPNDPDLVGTEKFDGASFFVPVASDGSLRFFSRRPSVKGGFPDRTESLPHLTAKKLPQYAGNVYNVELIHTGHHKDAPESHRMVSGILNSLSPRAVVTQAATGPIRAVLHNVINPELPTFGDKLKHMKEVEEAFGNPDVFFVVKHVEGPKAIQQLAAQTKAAGREGVIVTSSTESENTNVRWKIKHKIQHNLRVVRVLQEFDKDGKPKPSMGSLVCEDANGKEVAQVGSGFSKAQRADAWENPKDWIGKPIQVESMGLAVGKLRMPIYNGDADGELDAVL